MWAMWAIGVGSTLGTLVDKACLWSGWLWGSASWGCCECAGGQGRHLAQLRAIPGGRWATSSLLNGAGSCIAGCAILATHDCCGPFVVWGQAPSSNRVEEESQNGASQHCWQYGKPRSQKWLLPVVPTGEEGSPICLLTLWEALPVQQVDLTYASFKLLSLDCDSEHMRFCEHPLRAESLFSIALQLSWT